MNVRVRDAAHVGRWWRCALRAVRLGAAPAFLAGASAVLAAFAAEVPGRAELQIAQAGERQGVRVEVAATIAVAPASQVPLPVRVSPPDAIPGRSFLRVRGLPPTVSLSEGYVTAPGSWSVPLNALASLQVIVPAGVAGRAELSISLVAVDGAVLAEARSALLVEAPPPRPPAEVAAPPRPLPATRRPVLSPAEREAAERLMERGEAEVAQGNIAVARQFFLRAAQAGLARGALLLAATHDPRELARWRVQGVQPNLAEARKWYERARELGAPEAEERLARLGGG
jgi:hypothetical protein